MQSTHGHRLPWLLAAVVSIVLLVSQHERLSLLLDIGRAHAQPRYTVADRISQFGTEAQARLQPHFDAAGVAWPGQRVALLAFKDSRRLQLYAQGADQRWAFVRDYPVLAASGDPGPKLREGDRQVPEGFYRVTFLNANSLFHVSLRLDYPNAFDRQMARADGRSQLGGDIMIHGKAASIGCLAMGDAAAEELFTLAAQIGQQRIEVLIAPTDFRRPGTPTLAQQPAWLAGLYAQLAQSLARFPPAGAVE